MKAFSIIIISILLTAGKFKSGYDSLIYKPERKLTWDDFRGMPNYARREAGAQITVNIEYKIKKVSFWTGRAKYDVFAVAIPDKSYVKKGYRDDYTLAHEQIHFDIAHIYAESLEIEMNDRDIPIGQEEEILKKNFKEMSAYQALYDAETEGGNNKTKQKEWAQRIKADLAVFN